MYNDNRSGGYNNRPPRLAPVNVGDEVDVRIEAVGEKGDGIAKIKGFVLFVPGAKEGKTVRVKITKVLQKVGFAEIIGEAKAPVKSPRKDLYVSKEELDNEEPVYDSNYENTEDFGDEENSTEETPAEDKPTEESESSSEELTKDSKTESEEESAKNSEEKISSEDEKSE